MLKTIIFIGALYRWLFGITANREYVMEQCQVKYDKQCPAIENVIRTDGYYRSDERHSSIIFYPEGTFGSAVASWKNPTTEMLIPEYGMYSVSKDSILVNTILALELHKYWHLYEYKFHVLNCDSIELVSE
jgi:hypothetical protein